MNETENRIPVNDGGGLYDNDGLIDSLIVDCNGLVKDLFDGRYVKFCQSIVFMVQKLSNLKNGIQAEIASRDQIIAEQQRIINEAEGESECSE